MFCTPGPPASPSSHSTCERVSAAVIHIAHIDVDTGELGYDGLNGTREIGPSHAKSAIYI